MSSLLEASTALARNLRWLDDLQPAADLWRALASSQHLPGLADAGGSGELAARYLLEDLTRLSSPEPGALRLAYRQAASGPWLCGIRKMAWDSDHFGFGIGQIYPLVSPPVTEVGEEPIGEGVELLRRSLEHARHLGLRYVGATADPADNLSLFCLSRCGFALADTLVTHRLDLQGLSHLAGEPNVRPARESDRERVEAISAECFGNRLYNAHRFNSDPLFPAPAVRELYRLWVRNSCARKLADEVLVYELDGEPLGFITLSMPSPLEQERGMEVAHVPLNAVHPDHHGRGIYSSLVRAALGWFQVRAVKSVEIKTQLPNVAVHRAWSKLGARLWTSVHRFRLALDDLP